LRLIEGHCRHDAWNIDETRSYLKRGVGVVEDWGRGR
jgi:hypothetical protein